MLVWQPWVNLEKNDMMAHFIYCYDDYYRYGPYELFKKLKEIFLKKMRAYEIPSSILTTLHMFRLKLITKEKSKEAAEGKLKNDPDWEDYKGSINDDLDSFVNNLQNSEEIDIEDVWSFLTPKLTKEELKLVEQNNEEHMMTYRYNFFRFIGADVDVEEMKNQIRRKNIFILNVNEYLSIEIWNQNKLHPKLFHLMFSLKIHLPIYLKIYLRICYKMIRNKMRRCLIHLISIIYVKKQ